MSGEANVRRLALENFRNYKTLELNLDGRPVCLIGANGAGKTNIIEALSLFGPGRGLRQASLSDYIHQPDDQSDESEDRRHVWQIHLALNSADSHRTLKLHLARTASGRYGRVANLDDEKVASSVFVELIRLTWLTPQMDRVFQGPENDRRRLLDRLTQSHFPNHARHSAQYEKAMRERNTLFDHEYLDTAWMEALEERMALAAAPIAIARHKTINYLQEAINDADDSHFPKADIELDCRFSEMAGHFDEAQIADKLKTAFYDSRGQDRTAKRSLTGTHKAALIVRHRPKNMLASLCSTGEQKALLIGLMLANARAIDRHVVYDIIKPVPLLLLDEATAHLDEERRKALFDELEKLKGQCWLTGTDHMLFESFGERAQFVEIKNGRAEIV